MSFEGSQQILFLNSNPYMHSICSKCNSAMIPCIKIEGAQTCITCSKCSNEEFVNTVDYMYRFTSASLSSNHCLYHPDKPAADFCIKCYYWLCSYCSSQHSHKLLLKSCYRSLYFCEEHGRPYNSYCPRCNKHCCSGCLQIHLEHRPFKLSVKTDDIEILRKKVSEMLNSLNQYALNMKKMAQEKLKDVKEKIIQQLKERIEKVEKDCLYKSKLVEQEYQKNKNINENIKKIIFLLMDNYIPEKSTNFYLINNIKRNTHFNTNLLEKYNEIKALFELEDNSNNAIVNNITVNIEQNNGNNQISPQNVQNFQIVNNAHLQNAQNAQNPQIRIINQQHPERNRVIQLPAQTAQTFPQLDILKRINKLIEFYRRTFIISISPIKHFSLGTAAPVLITSLYLLRDGRLAIGHNKYIRILDIINAQIHSTLSGHTHIVNGIGELSDGRIISCSFDRTIRIWTLDGDIVSTYQTLNAHANKITKLITLTVNRFASSSLDSTIKIWSSDSSLRPIKVIQNKNNLPVFAILQLKNKDILFSSSKIIGFWDLNTYELINEMEGLLQPTPAIEEIEGERIVLGGVDSMLIVDVKNMQVICNIREKFGEIKDLKAIGKNIIISGTDLYKLYLDTCEFGIVSYVDARKPILCIINYKKNLFLTGAEQVSIWE